MAVFSSAHSAPHHAKDVPPQLPNALLAYQLPTLLKTTSSQATAHVSVCVQMVSSYRMAQQLAVSVIPPLASHVQVQQQVVFPAIVLHSSTIVHVSWSVLTLFMDQEPLAFLV